MSECKVPTPTQSTPGSNAGKRERDADSWPTVASSTTSGLKRRNEDAHIGGLPDEMLEEILSYLDLGDRLAARQVCLRWDKVLTSWSGFLDSVTLVAEPAHLLDQTWVPWRTLVVNGSGSSDIMKLEDVLGQSQSFTESVTGLVLNDGTWSWPTVQAFITSFRRLDKLSLINCTGPTVNSEECVQAPEDLAGFMEFRKRLKELKVESSGVREINFYLKKLTGNDSSLKNLELIATPCAEEYVKYARKKSTPSAIFGDTLSDFLDTCKGTLRSLKLSVYNSLIQVVCLVLRDLNVKLSTFSFGWTYLSHARHLDEKTILTFVKGQSELKSLELPPLRLTGGIRKLEAVLPSGLQELSMVQDKILSAPICQKLMEVKSLSARFSKQLGRYPFGSPWTVFPELRSLALTSPPNFPSMPAHLVTSFPNLFKLSIVTERDRDSLTNKGLQTIISRLPHLNTLIVSPSNCLSDSGITGFRKSDVKKLLASKNGYFKNTLAKLGIVLFGPALSSLKGLKKVCFLNGNPASGFSDAGIMYGLNFNGMKILKFHGSPQMTDWGLAQLGRSNPVLEELTVTLCEGRVTGEAIDQIRTALPRIPERKFSVAVPIKPMPPAAPEPDSDSDEELLPFPPWVMLDGGLILEDF